MSDDLELIEFQCPDCTNGWTTFAPILRAFQSCKTCDGTGKVLVKRENLIKLSARK